MPCMDHLSEDGPADQLTISPAIPGLWIHSRTLLKYRLHQDQDLFERAYAYIREYY